MRSAGPRRFCGEREGECELCGVFAKASPIVDAVYPPLARQARIQGVVRFNVIIAQDGHVRCITLVNGYRLLVPAAQEAVKQWVYRPRC